MTQVIPSVTLAGGVDMPVVGFGTWQISGRRGYDAVRSALDAGYRHIDTATMYNNESEVGRAIRESGVPRDEVFITTKLPPGRIGQERQTLTASLKSLGVDRVDLWLIHWPPNRSAAPETWREFIAARDAGLTRSIGVSNYSTAQIDELTKVTGETPAVNQIPWSPPEHRPHRLRESRERNVVVEGYSPLKGSNLRHPVLTEIAAVHGVTPAQVVLRWHLQHDIVIIPKSSHADRMRTNVDLFGFTLSEEEMARVDGLSSHS